MARNHKQNLHFTKQTFGSVCVREAAMTICLLFSLILLVLDASNSKALNQVKISLQSSFSAVFSISNEITANIDDFFMNFNTVSELNKKNKDLENENSNMQLWINKALRYEAENKSLKELLKFKNPEGYETESARISINNSGSFNKNVVISLSNAHKNQTVVSSHGLVGRVINFTDTDANILLITDNNSKVPGIIERTRDKLIVIGRNSKSLDLEYLPEDSEITLGDRIITSGDGQVFVPGLLIGTVSYIEGKNIEITPSTNFNKLEFVSILREITNYEL